jgi:hypothetical protein
MDAQNELNFRLARSQFLYEQADRKAHKRDWSKWHKAFWLILTVVGCIFVIVVEPRTLVLFAFLLFVYAPLKTILAAGKYRS